MSVKLIAVICCRQKQRTMKNLTTEQKETVRILIELGDSKELAIKTVLETVKHDDEIYQIAYYS